MGIDTRASEVLISLSTRASYAISATSESRCALARDMESSLAWASGDSPCRHATARATVPTHRAACPGGCGSRREAEATLPPSANSMTRAGQGSAPSTTPYSRTMLGCSSPPQSSASTSSRRNSSGMGCVAPSGRGSSGKARGNSRLTATTRFSRVSTAL